MANTCIKSQGRDDAQNSDCTCVVTRMKGLLATVLATDTKAEHPVLELLEIRPRVSTELLTTVGQLPTAQSRAVCPADAVLAKPWSLTRSVQSPAPAAQLPQQYRDSAWSKQPQTFPRQPYRYTHRSQTTSNHGDRCGSRPDARSARPRLPWTRFHCAVLAGDKLKAMVSSKHDGEPSACSATSRQHLLTRTLPMPVCPPALPSNAPVVQLPDPVPDLGVKRGPEAGMHVAWYLRLGGAASPRRTAPRVLTFAVLLQTPPPARVRQLHRAVAASLQLSGHCEPRAAVILLQRT